MWGSTYLAIRYAVDGLPPLLTASTRFLVAAALVGLFVRLRRGAQAFRASRRAWLNAAVIGLLLLLGGNGGVVVAEDRGLPSGLTALIVAGVPLYVVVLRLVLRDRPSPRTLAGVAIGFVGLGVLLLPGARPHGVPAGAAALVVGCSSLWAVGSVVATRVELPADPLVTTVAEMLGGAAGLALVATLRGEGLPTAAPRLSAVLALAYLVVFGSVVAFTAYSWLLGTAPVSKVATYAYVNPVVAVVLGALVTGEQVTVPGAVGGLITVLAVFVVVSQEGAGRTEVDAPEPVAAEP